MTDAALIRCAWDGDAFRPSSAMHAHRAREAFGAGEIVLLNVQNERSMISHRHFFATLHDLWANLPERLAGQDYAKSPDTLRKRALIATGFANVETIVCGSKAAAERVAAYVGVLATKVHGYAITEAAGNVARCWTPQTQSVAGMGAKEFQRSKTAVLEWCDALLSPAGEAAA